MSIFGAIIFASVLLSSCTSVNKAMREPNVKVDLTKSDFTLSEQVKANATSTTIIGIDFERLFTKKTGNVEGGSVQVSLASVPVVGNLLIDKTANYALYELMSNNPGYDVIFFPQYEVKVVRPFFGIGLIYKTTTVETTARLGKLNK
jgi:hypothetical protein